MSSDGYVRIRLDDDLEDRIAQALWAELTARVVANGYNPGTTPEDYRAQAVAVVAALVAVSFTEKPGEPE